MLGYQRAFVGPCSWLMLNALAARAPSIVSHAAWHTSTCCSCRRVYKAQLDGAPVAAKIIHPSAARREDAVSSFLREAHLLARLSHGQVHPRFLNCFFACLTSLLSLRLCSIQ